MRSRWKTKLFGKPKVLNTLLAAAQIDLRRSALVKIASAGLLSNDTVMYVHPLIQAGVRCDLMARAKSCFDGGPIAYK